MINIAIKEATREAHLALEKKVIRKIKVIQNSNDYANFLKYFYAYFNHLESAIAPFITEARLPGHKDRRDSNYLKRDIEALGGNTDNLPNTTAPVIENHLQAFGALYVMEGSIMGGRIIVKLLENVGIRQGVSFFSGYGENTEEIWELFGEAFNAQVECDEHAKIMIQTANDTFAHFSLVFDQDVVTYPREVLL